VKPLAPWQLRAWLAVAVGVIVAMACLWIAGSVLPTEARADPEPPLPQWVTAGSIMVLGREPVRVTGPDGEPWYVVRWAWRDVVIESVHAGPWAEREAEILRAVLTARMVGEGSLAAHNR
jgi:uncharacterized SAM-binding protein YcdF (DUF218 family)